MDASGNREVNPLQLDNLTWQRAIGAKTTDFLHDHSAATVARTKMMVFGWVKRNLWPTCQGDWLCPAPGLPYGQGSACW